MTSSVTTTDTLTSFITEIWPASVPEGLSRDRFMAAIAFVLLRYSENVSPKLKHLNEQNKILIRSWEIKENTTLGDLETRWSDAVNQSTPDLSELSAWNPVFLQSNNDDILSGEFPEGITGSSRPDLYFIISSSKQPALGILSSHRKHTSAFLKQMTEHWIQSVLLLDGKSDFLARNLPILSDAEYQRMVYDWNDTDKPSDNGKFDFEEFDERVEQVPDKVAISSGSDSLTYKQLQEKANRMAHLLQSYGIGPEVVVGIHLPRSIDFVVCLVGLIKSGGAFLPLDPDHPKDRKEFMIHDSKVSLIITSQALKNNLPKGSNQTLIVEELETPLTSFPTDTPDHGLQKGGMAYLFYTSGSTGQPKGVIMTHTYQDKKSDQEKKDAPIKDEKVLLKSPAGFTVILLETFAAIKAGGEIVVVPKDREKDSRWLVDNIRKEKIETLNTVPSMLSLLLQDGLNTCTSLKKVFTIGERLPVAVQREFFNRMLKTQLFVFYGCTEAPSATFREILKDENYGDRVILGKAQNNKKIYILDKFKVPVPIGVPGEIYIGGKISRGYINNEALTKERFIANPFTKTVGDRIYQTGDSGQFLEDGTLEYLGRTDFQVQIRGIRVEPTEIDLCVMEHPSINECVTVAREDAGGDSRLVAYYVLAKHAPPPEVQDLATFVRQRLPDYMVPSAFVPIAQIPLLLNGKIDRSALPDYVIVGSRTTKEPQGTELEKRLTLLWEEILDAKRVSLLDNFFGLGGNSLKVLRLCQKVQATLIKPLSAADVYENPTVTQLARLLQDEKGGQRFAHFFGGEVDKTPLFFMPGIARNALVFTPLAENMSQERPCYGIELPSMENGKEPLTSIEDMAAHCVSELKRIQPIGPYLLAGYSFGGLLAFEAARQLRQSDNADCKVVLFDTRLFKPMHYTLTDRIRWSLKMLGQEKQHYCNYVLRELYFKLMGVIGLGEKFEPYRDVDYQWGDLSAITPKTFNKVYKPKNCDAPVLLFTARDTEYSITSGHDLKNWDDCCTRPIERYRIDTDYHVDVINARHLEFIEEKMNLFFNHSA